MNVNESLPSQLMKNLLYLKGDFYNFWPEKKRENSDRLAFYKINGRRTCNG